MNWNRLFIIIGCFSIFRLLFVPFMGLMPQGAYYSFYAEHLDWSYYDHPPMIAYFLALFFSLFGQKVWVVKLMTWTVSSLTLWMTYLLARKIYEPQLAEKSLALLSTTIMASILCLVATPDVPLLLFWSLSLWFLYGAIFEHKKLYWVWAGLAMGLAFDSKYTAIFLPFCLFVYLVFSEKNRKYLSTIWPYVSGFVMLLIMTPVIYWNVEHDFASFAYQGATRAQTIADEGWKPEHILGSIAMQSTVLVPVLFVFIFMGLYIYFKKYRWSFRERDNELFLLSFFLPVFGGFMALSIMYWVKLNWIMPAYLSGAVFLAAIMPSKWFRAQLWLSVILHIAIAIQVFFYVVPIKSDDTWWGWEELAEQVENIQEEQKADFIFAGDHYKTTAQLGFHMDQKVYAHNVIGSHSVHYDMVYDDFSYLNGKDALYVDSDPSLRRDSLSGKRKEQLLYYFNEVEEQEPILLRKGDKVVRKFFIYTCKGYKWKPGWYSDQVE